MSKICYILHHKENISKERDSLANDIVLKMNECGISELKTETIYPKDYDDLMSIMPNEMKIVNSMSIGAIGLYLSNYFAWKKFVNSEYDYAIVFEDDAIVKNNFLNVLNLTVDFLLNLKESGSIVSFFSHKSQSTNYIKENHYIGSDLICKGYAFYASPAYLIDKAAARTLIKDSTKNGIQYPLDIYLFNYATKINKVFGIMPKYKNKPIGVKFLNNHGMAIAKHSTIHSTEWVHTGSSYFDIENIIPNTEIKPIPKIIHRIHLGPNESQLVKDAWGISKLVNANWAHITHNENNLDQFPICKNYLDFSKQYSFKSDLMRLEALYNWGGVYIDTDVFCIKPFDDLVKAGSIIVGYENDITLGAAVIAATPKNPKILEMLNDMILNLLKESANESGFIYGPNSMVFGPNIFSKHLLNDEQTVKFPIEYFYPAQFVRPNHENHIKNNESIPEYIKRVSKYFTENTYCVHGWAGSWQGE